MHFLGIDEPVVDCDCGAWFRARRAAAGLPGNPEAKNGQCSPKRTGDVTLRIEHRDPELVVETKSRD